MKTLYLSTNSRFLLLIIVALLFSLNQAAYAEGLSGLKESLNKGKIKQIIINKPDQQPGDVKNSSSELTSTIKFKPKPNILKQSKTQLLDSSEAIEKYIKQVKNSKTFKKDFKLNGGSLKKALLKFSKNNKNKLKRIGEKVQPVILEDDQQQKQTSRAWISPLTASFPPETKDTVELEAIRDVIDFHNIINDPEFYNDSFINLITKMVQIEYILFEAYEKYSKYPYICAMLKFYCTEMRASILGIYDASYTAEKKFEQIYETYYANRLDNECCRDILDMTLNRKSEIVSILNNELTQRINEADTHINDVNNYIKEMKDTIHPSEHYAPTKEHIEAVYSEIISSYETIISSHLKKGEYKEAHLKLLEMEKYYSETPTKFTVKYWKEVFNSTTQQYEKIEQSKTYDIKKRTQRYFAAIKSYVGNGGDYSEIDEESSETVLKNINSYIEKVKTYVPSADEECSPETLKYFQEQIDNKSSSSETSDHYYSQNRNITKIYFTRNENKELDSQDIPDPKDNLALRCETDSKGPLYPFKQDVISTTSNRTKPLKLKKDWFYAGNYYAVFQPNETDEEPLPPTGPVTVAVVVKEGDNTPIPSENLVDRTRDAQKESISVLSGFKSYEDGLKLYNNKEFFRYRNARASWKGADLPNNVIDVTKEFCISGGEVIYADCQTATGYAVVANQADWFMIEADGDFDGHIEFVDSKDNVIKTFPNELEGMYGEDIDVLILDACYCLEWWQRQTAQKWQKVLPKGLILGFDHKVSPDYTGIIYTNLSNNLKKGMLPKEIGDLYLDVNKIILNNNASYLQNGSGTYEKAVYLLDGHTYGYLEKASFTNRYQIKIEGYIRKYRKI